jgi:hypothetical protein
MTDSEIILFKTLAAKYLWWMMPDEGLKHPDSLGVLVPVDVSAATEYVKFLFSGTLIMAGSANRR